MCGRFVQVLSRMILEMLYGVEVSGELVPRYNLAPSQHALVLRLNQEKGTKELASLQWGLLPHWVKDERGTKKPINARVETVEQKPFFRDAFRRRRALIPVNGYYEWKKENGKKQPYLIRCENEQPFSLAGLWEQGAKGRETFTILTAPATGVVTAIHSRMPLVIPLSAYDHWLNSSNPLPELQNLLRAQTPPDLFAYPVSTIVNNPAHDCPECIQPIGS